MKRLKISKLILIVLILPIVATANDADIIVKKMVKAMSDLSYQGTYVYLHGDKLETIKLKHTNFHGLQRESLLSLNGEAREIIRSNNTVSCILPSQKAIIIDKARTQFSGINKLTFYSESLKKIYTFRHLGNDRIAGRKAHVIHIDPNDEYRYAHTLWIDKGNYLLLKSKISDEKNQTIEQLIFTDINIIKEDDLVPIKLMKEHHFMQLKTVENKTKELDRNTSGWRFNNIPAGYKFMQYFKKTLSQSGKEINQWLFSDGLISYSIFIKKREGVTSMPKNMITMGSVNVITTIKDGYVITVMGEVPAKTIMMASNGVSKN